MIHTVVTGNIGKDAVLREAGENTVCSFSIASNAKVKGEKVTTWVDCSIWGKRGEALVKHLSKGTRVAAVGELSTRQHEGKTYLQIRVDQIDLLGGGERKEEPKSSGRGDAYEGDENEPNW